MTDLQRGEMLDYLEQMIDYLDRMYKREGDLRYSAACEDMEYARNTLMDDSLFGDLKER